MPLRCMWVSIKKLKARNNRKGKETPLGFVNKQNYRMQKIKTTPDGRILPVCNACWLSSYPVLSIGGQVTQYCSVCVVGYGEEAELTPSNHLPDFQPRIQTRNLLVVPTTIRLSTAPLSDPARDNSQISLLYLLTGNIF